MMFRELVSDTGTGASAEYEFTPGGPRISSSAYPSRLSVPDKRLGSQRFSAVGNRTGSQRVGGSAYSARLSAPGKGVHFSIPEDKPRESAVLGDEALMDRTPTSADAIRVRGSLNEDVLHVEHEPLPANVYGFAMSMVIRDLIWLRHGSRVRLERVARITNSFLVIGGTITLQVFLLLAVSRLLCAKSLERIRSTYGEYEYMMYPNQTYITINGFHRGIAGYRQDDNFLKMSGEFASEVCEIPLSHSIYLGAVLLVWTFTCQVELRTIFETSYRLFYATPTVWSLDDVFAEDCEEHAHNVQGLTPGLKLSIALFVQIPRFVTLVALLWLGCRWLTSTLGLDDVLLNCLALEFMVLLKDVLYKVCISHRNQFETEQLFIRPFRDVNKASFCTFFDSQMYGILCFAFVWGYVYHWQEVLPDYRWDVHDLCEKHLMDLVSVTQKPGSRFGV